MRNHFAFIQVAANELLAQQLLAKNRPILRAAKTLP
jgi:hypothetical protein